MVFDPTILIAFDCIFCDTNFHYIVAADGTVKDGNGTVHIGSHSWIGNSTTIMRGALLPSHTIVASKSFVNKDFRSYGDGAGIVIAGSPGKVVRQGMSCVFSSEQEQNIRTFFRDHPDATEMKL